MNNCFRSIMIGLFLLALFMLVASFANAMTFEDMWATRIRPEPYSGIATTFDDRLGAWGNRLDHRKNICANRNERRGTLLRVTNVNNGKSVDCEVQDYGPATYFWPRREVDLSAQANRAIGCSGYCPVKIERLPNERF